jgi:hypothetical protein
VDLRRREVLAQAPELLGVLAAAHVGVVPVAEALVAGVGEHPLGLSRQSLVLEVERALERLGLEPACELVLVGRERALDRVAQHRQHAHVGQVLRHPRGSAGVEHVVAARLEGDRLTGNGPAPTPQAAGRREVPLVPREVAVVVDVEVVDTLVEVRRVDQRVRHQRAVERRGAGALGADQDERRELPPGRCDRADLDRHLPAHHLEAVRHGGA